MKFTTQPLVLVRVEAPAQIKRALIDAAGRNPAASIYGMIYGEYDFILPVEEAEKFVAWLKADGIMYDPKNWPRMVV